MEKHGAVSPRYTPDTEERVPTKQKQANTAGVVESLDDDFTKRAAAKVAATLKTNGS